MTISKNYVDGEWVGGPDVNRDINPSNLGDVVGEYSRADGAQARAAIAAARAAFPAWARGNIQQRADLLATTRTSRPRSPAPSRARSTLWASAARRPAGWS